MRAEAEEEKGSGGAIKSGRKRGERRMGASHWSVTLVGRGGRGRERHRGGGKEERRERKEAHFLAPRGGERGGERGKNCSNGRRPKEKKKSFASGQPERGWEILKAVSPLYSPPLALPPFPAPLCRGKCEVINRRFFSPSFSPSDPLYTFVVSRLVVFRPEISRPPQ